MMSDSTPTFIPDPEEVSDVIVLLEKSLGLSFDDTAFAHVRTFGTLCHVFESYLPLHQTDDCTTQQAFYKIRHAIRCIHSANQPITPNSVLADILPAQAYRKSVLSLENQLGVYLHLLHYPKWIATLLGIGFVLSLGLFFLDWKAAIASCLVCHTFFQMEAVWGSELTPLTIRQLTQKLVHDHYQHMRRRPETVNRREIRHMLTAVFSDLLGIEAKNLTQDTPIFI